MERPGFRKNGQFVCDEGSDEELTFRYQTKVQQKEGRKKTKRAPCFFNSRQDFLDSKGMVHFEDLSCVSSCSQEEGVFTSRVTVDEVSDVVYVSSYSDIAVVFVVVLSEFFPGEREELFLLCGVVVA